MNRLTIEFGSGISDNRRDIVAEYRLWRNLAAHSRSPLPMQAWATAWPPFGEGAQQVTWNRPIFLPCPSLNARIACGVGRVTTLQCFLAK